MKAIITLHNPKTETGIETIIIKGKRLVVNQIESNTLTVSDDGRLLGVYPNIKSLELKGKPKPKKVAQEQNAYATPSLADEIVDALRRNFSYDGFANVIADGIAKAEQQADEKSQARWAVESNHVATAHPDFEAFINSKMTSEDCAQFGVAVARAERDANDHKIGELEQRLEELEADIDTDALPQAMQDREMLYGRITKLQELIKLQHDSTSAGDSYMRGLLNGLILGEATMLEECPIYMDPPPVRSEAIIDPKVYQAEDAAGEVQVEFKEVNDESNTPHGADRGAKKK